MKLLTTLELDECDSTNDEAWKYVRETGITPLLIVSNRQKRGRGRQGRSWVSPGQPGAEGNIAVSLAIKAPERCLSWMPLAAGVATIEAITQACELVPEAELGKLRLKWPNDIMCGKKKMGGILCESRIVGERVDGLVLGLGLNLVQTPHIEGIETSSLIECAYAEQTPTPVTLSAMRRFLIHAWAMRTLYWTSELSRGETEPLRRIWTDSAQLNNYDTFIMHDESGKLITAHALDLQDDGKLRVSIPCGDGSSEILLLDQAE